MKSNEEFIAGIYEKAAVYTEEKENKIIQVTWTARATRIAAMLVICIGLAGVSSFMLDNKSMSVPEKIPMPANEDYGIALSSETGGETGGVAQFRIGPVAEFVTFTGVVENIDTEGNRIRLELIFDEGAPDHAEGSVVYIRFDILETMSEEITVGTTLTATGTLSEYEGCAELVLTNLEDLQVK